MHLPCIISQPAGFGGEGLMPGLSQLYQNKLLLGRNSINFFIIIISIKNYFIIKIPLQLTKHNFYSINLIIFILGICNNEKKCVY